MGEVIVRALVTGATGIVGSEVVALLRARGHDVTAVSARGSTDGSVIAWRMGVEPCPQHIPTPDVVIQAAADTRWTLAPGQAIRGNVDSLAALTSVVGPSTRTLLLSTAHAIGHGRGDPTALESYRNTYEWSKAAAERMLATRFDQAGTIRFPVVVGRRSDGHLQRLAGLVRLCKPLVTGLVPAIIGHPDALFDFVPVDDVAALVVDAATRQAPPPRLQVLGQGDATPTVAEVFEMIFDTLDRWRLHRGAPPLARPPIIPPERWDRFHMPMARRHLSEVQLRLVDLLSEYRPYLCITEPFRVDVRVEDAPQALRRSVTWWADTHPRLARAVPQAWRSPAPADIQAAAPR